MVQKIYITGANGIPTEITSTFNEIQNAMASSSGLSDFATELQKKHFDFLARLNQVNLENYKDLANFVSEAQKSIDDAERDTTLKGNFRETNLDWAYLKRKDVREYAEALLQVAKDEKTRNFCTTAARKMKR